MWPIFPNSKPQRAWGVPRVTRGDYSTLSDGRLLHGRAMAEGGWFAITDGMSGAEVGTIGYNPAAAGDLSQQVLQAQQSAAQTAAEAREAQDSLLRAIQERLPSGIQLPTAPLSFRQLAIVATVAFSAMVLGSWLIKKGK